MTDTDTHLSAAEYVLCEKAALLEAEANCRFEGGYLAHALDLQREAMKYRRQLGDLAYEAEGMQRIGFLQLITGDFRGAMASYGRAHELARQMKDCSAIGTAPHSD